MKYCPYCGATLMGGAASFCVECGKKTPPPEKTPNPTRESPARQHPGRKPPAGKKPPANARNPARPNQKEKPVSTKKRPPPHRPGKRQEPPRPPKPDPRDEGYDGYYDDVLPIDNGHTRERADPALLKRAAIIAAGALGIVILSVILMYVL